MKIGIIGCGNMGEGIARRLVFNNELFLYDRHVAATEGFAQQIGAKACSNLKDFLNAVELIILAVKPKDLATIANQLLDKLASKHVLVSVLAGTTLATLSKTFGEVPLVRMMPNLAVVHGKGVLGLSAKDTFDAAKRKQLTELFLPLGLVKWLPESMMDAVTALTGSGPAFALVMIEAMTEAAITMGFNAAEGQELVLQMLQGVIAMLQETQKHPSALKWQIASPAGTTIAGLNELENNGLRHAIIRAFLATFERSKQMSKE